MLHTAESCSQKSKKARTENMSRVHSSTRAVAYLPSLKTIVQRLRATNATPSSLNSTLLTTTTGQLTTPISTQTSECHHQQTHTGFKEVLNSPISTITYHLSLHPSLPLPGAIGLITDTSPSTTSNTTDTGECNSEDVPSILSSIKNKPHETVECMVQEVPGFLVADFLLLFPGVNVEGRGLNVITLSQRTINNMTGWSPDVEEEREKLLKHFIESSREICSRLNAADYWADFIDPSSGRAYFSAYSNSTLFETDDRFRYLGFDIMDLGCCKCIRHPIWGAFTFVGAIFTTAPTNSQAIQNIMEL